MALKPREHKFIEEYIRCSVAGLAAQRAGYATTTKASCYTQGYKLLRRVDIQRALRQRRAELAKDFKISYSDYLTELAAVAFSRLKNHVEYNKESGVKLLHDDDVEDDAAVKSVSETNGKAGYSVKVELHDKIKALDLLGKTLGFTGDNSGESDKGSATDQLLAALAERLKGGKNSPPGGEGSG